MLPLDQVHVGLVRGWQCAYEFCWRSQTSYETAERSMPPCLKTLASALLSNMVWTVQLDMRGLHNLLSNFLIQLSTLISHILISPFLSTFVSGGYKIYLWRYFYILKSDPNKPQCHEDMMHTPKYKLMFTSKVMHIQIVLCKSYMNHFV